MGPWRRCIEWRQVNRLVTYREELSGGKRSGRLVITHTSVMGLVRKVAGITQKWDIAAPDGLTELQRWPNSSMSVRDLTQYPPSTLDGAGAGSLSIQDSRLTKRFHTLINQLSEGTAESIPLACQDWASTKAAYRFLSNDRVSVSPRPRAPSLCFTIRACSPSNAMIDGVRAKRSQ